MTGEPGNDIPREFDFVRLARILLRRRKLIITIAACGTMAAVITGLLIAPEYTATARIVVEPERAISSRAEVSLPNDQLLTEINTHVVGLASRDFLRHVLDSLTDSAHSSTAVDAAANERATTGLPDSYLPQHATVDRAATPTTLVDPALSFDELDRRLKIWLAALADRGPDRELDTLQRELRVLQERTSRVISVRFTTKSPEQAAAVANRVVQLYVNGLAQQKRAQANQQLAAVDERAAHLRSELNADRTLGSLQPSVVGGTYARMLGRKTEISAQQDVVGPEVRIVSLASPPDRPSSVNPILFIFPALIASLIGASLLAVLLERLDHRLRSERDVTDALGLPCIGLVPQLPRSYAHRPLHYLQNEPFTPYAESIRSALAAIHLAQPRRKPTTILISSSVQGEGKTTVAASLAVYAAQLGKRVLLIDFDSRHPSIMRILRSLPQAPVSDLQDRPLEELIQHVADLHLDYLAVSHGKADPLVPFIGEHMQHVLRQLGNSYDCVFIDGPPLLGITETRLLAGLVDSVIFVVKWGDTRRDVVQNAGEVLRNVRRPNGRYVARASALVTQVDLRRHANYRYGDVGEAYARYAKYYFARSDSPDTFKGISHAGGDAGPTAYYYAVRQLTLLSATVVSFLSVALSSSMVW